MGRPADDSATEPRRGWRPGLLTATLAAGVVLSAVLAVVVLVLRDRLRAETRRSLVERAASVLAPLADRQVEIAEREPAADDRALLLPVLHSARFDGMAAVAVYDASGRLVRAFPETFIFAELPPRDFLTLLAGAPVSRFHGAFPLDRYFSPSVASLARPAILEVAVALHRSGEGAPVGFAQYYLDARGLAAELAVVEAQIDRLTWGMLGLGWGALSLVLGVAYWALRRAQLRLAARSVRLAQANLELTLAAKSSALGQITSHLIHGLQGPVAGLRAMALGAGEGILSVEDRGAAAEYVERMQRLVGEAVQLLGETSATVRYEVTGDELVAAIDQRVRDEVRSRKVGWAILGGGGWTVDNRCAGVVGLIAANLVQNAARATPEGRRVGAELLRRDGVLALRVHDEGAGIPEELRARLFTPGVSGRAEGTGLGLAISRLLARQVNGELTLERTGPDGTSFALTIPLAETAE